MYSSSICTVYIVQNGFSMIPKFRYSDYNLMFYLDMSNSSEYLGSGVEPGGTRRNKIKDPGSRIPPTFKSGPRVYKEELGTTALLLCKVNNLGKISSSISPLRFNGLTFSSLNC